jgi:hypothetical protein
VRVDVGPVARGSAVAWIAWADEVCGELRNDPSTRFSCPSPLSGVGGYLQQWKKRSDLSAGGTFRWHAELDPDHLEFLIHGLLRLDAQLAVEVEDGRRTPPPNEAREFHLVLVRDLLNALEMEGTGRAAFVDQLRCCWPGAAEAS